MPLSGSEKEQIIHALQYAFPRYADLKYMVSIQLGENIEVIAPAGSVRDYIFELVDQMEAQGRLEELLRGALKQNPRNPQLIRCCVDFGLITDPNMDSLSSSRHGGVLTRSKQPPLPQPLRTEIVDLLLQLPGIQSYDVRSSLLRGLPSMHTLYRNSSAARQDLMGIIDQLCLLGRTLTREWPLVLLLDNAMEGIRGYALEEDMKQLQQALLKYYREV